MNAPCSQEGRNTVPGQRILSLWFPYLSTERIWRHRLGRAWRDNGAALRPLVISHQDNNTRRIAALDKRAEALGLRPGMGIADAQAMHPTIEIVEADRDADRQLLESLADWCDRYTPLVALDGNDGLFLDITGCAHLFGGERAMLDDILARLPRQGFDVCAGIASTAGAAWAAARFHGDGVVACGAEAGMLAPLPLTALRIEADTRARLESVGLRSVGAVMAAPRAPLARRFGKALLMRLDQALGDLDEALSPRLPVPPLSAERRLAEPIMAVDDIERLVLLLAGSLKTALERRGEGARALQLRLFRVDGTVSRLSLGTARPVREPQWIARLFHERLTALESDLDAGFGFDLVRLAVYETAPLPAHQTDLADNGDDDNAADLALFVDRVSARLGKAAVLRPVAVASHIPERAVTALPFAEAENGLRAERRETKSGPSPVPERPLRLLRRPEPVDVMAEVPEGPPVHFRWRRARYSITRSEGPERISPEWWLENIPKVDVREDEDPEEARERAEMKKTAGSTRDYFRVEDADGRRYWLYRQGLYGMSNEAPRWFLHGLFA